MFFCVRVFDRPLSCYKYRTAPVGWCICFIPIVRNFMKTVRGGGLFLAASEWPIAGVFCRPLMAFPVTCRAPSVMYHFLRQMRGSSLRRRQHVSREPMWTGVVTLTEASYVNNWGRMWDVIRMWHLESHTEILSPVKCYSYQMNFDSG